MGRKGKGGKRGAGGRPKKADPQQDAELLRLLGDDSFFPDLDPQPVLGTEIPALSGSGGAAPSKKRVSLTAGDVFDQDSDEDPLSGKTSGIGGAAPSKKRISLTADDMFDLVGQDGVLPKTSGLGGKFLRGPSTLLPFLDYDGCQ